MAHNPRSGPKSRWLDLGHFQNRNSVAQRGCDARGNDTESEDRVDGIGTVVGICPQAKEMAWQVGSKPDASNYLLFPTPSHSNSTTPQTPSIMAQSKQSAPSLHVEIHPSSDSRSLRRPAPQSTQLNYAVVVSLCPHSTHRPCPSTT